MTRVTFTVQGSTTEELGKKAVAELKRLAGVDQDHDYKPLSCEIEASPLVMNGDGSVQLWEGDVTAEVEG